MFAYCNNNPIIGKDSTGHFDIEYYIDSENGQNISSRFTAGATVVVAVLVVGGLYLNHSNQQKQKPVNLPSKNKVEPAMDHIVSGYTPGGDRNPDGKKSVFYGLAANEIRKAIMEAYGTASKLQTQGPRIKLIGYSSTYNLVIEMWVNIVTYIIETAYPK